MDNFDMDDLPGSSSGSSSAAAAAAAAVAAAKRKRQSQSCDACRVRKVKCEPATEADEAPSSSSSAAGGKKPCKHCIVLGLECTYEYKVSPFLLPAVGPFAPVYEVPREAGVIKRTKRTKRMSC